MFLKKEGISRLCHNLFFYIDTHTHTTRLKSHLSIRLPLKGAHRIYIQILFFFFFFWLPPDDRLDGINTKTATRKNEENSPKFETGER